MRRRLYTLLGLSALFSIASAFGAETTPAPPQAVFEGLAWGGNEDRLREVFGSRLAKTQCTDEERKAQATRRRLLKCGSLFVNDYTIEGISARVIFTMGGPDNTLTEVRLERIASATKDQIKAGGGAEYDFNQVKSALVRRYGEPVSNGKPGPLSKRSSIDLSESWIDDGAVIRMMVLTLPNKSGQMYVLGVTYEPINEKSANAPFW